MSFSAAILFLAACAPFPIPTSPAPSRVVFPSPVRTAGSVVVVPQVTPAVPQTVTPSPTLAAPSPSPVPQSSGSAAMAQATLPASPTQSPTFSATSTSTPAPETPEPVSFLQQRITNLYDLSRLPVMENSVARQLTSRNWVAREHYFDYFVDDGNFVGSHYGYFDENGNLNPYQIVTGYDGKPEYEIVPRVQGPGTIDRIWLAYQQHQSINNAADMSQLDDWSNWGNLGAMGNIRFYFDDETTPRLDFLVKDLFVGRNPFPAPLAAFYASADGGNINYVPVPFNRSIRVTTTGRPRLMQIEVKQFTNTSVQSFSPNLTPGEQAALDRAVQAWQTCTPSQTAAWQSFALAIPHNESAEVDLQSPATIAGLRVRIPRGMEDSVWMQVFWDGEPEPSMVAPLRGMFGTDERLLPYRSLPLGTLAAAGELVFYNNLPMPFRSARLVFVNDRGETLPLTLEVALQATTPGAENSRLHAFYGTMRMNAREDDGEDYVLIDVQGRGKYVGTIFSAWDLDRRALNGPLPQTWRFPYLESNMDIWVDGRLALPGTGIEDDFNASYYYVFAGYEGYKTTYCLAGLTLLDYGTPKEPSSQYRFYLNDAPEFRDHLRVQAQHGNKGNNLAVTYSSTAFWYQVRPY